MKDHVKQAAHRVVIVIGGIDALPGHYDVACNFLQRMKYPVLYEYGNTLVLRSLRHPDKLSIAVFENPGEDCYLTTYDLGDDMPDLEQFGYGRG